jgi:hypothetical protein
VDILLTKFSSADPGTKDFRPVNRGIGSDMLAACYGVIFSAPE